MPPVTAATSASATARNLVVIIRLTPAKKWCLAPFFRKRVSDTIFPRKRAWHPFLKTVADTIF